MFQILDTGVAAAEENMQGDEVLLEQLDAAGHPILHFYEWDGPTATFGHFTKPAEHLDLDRAAARHLRLARRPTGGGIVFHIWDFAFSFLMPSGHPAFSINPLENYKFVNEMILGVVARLFSLDQPQFILKNAPSSDESCGYFCMARPTQYDVMYHGMKIAGAAQRKRKQGYLHQGTISLAFPQLEFLQDVLRSKQAVVEAMSSYTFAPLGSCWSPTALREARLALKQCLTEKFMEKL